MKVLGVNQYISNIFENIQNTEPITDIAEIEKCFKDVAEHCNGPVLGDDRDEVLSDINQNEKQYVLNLMRCDIPAELTDNMKKYIDIIFSKYVSSYFGDFIFDDVDLREYQDYEDFLSCEDEKYESEVGLFFETKMLYCYNAGICYYYYKNADMYVYYDADETYGKIISAYNDEWNKVHGELHISGEFVKTNKALRDVWNDFVKDAGDPDNWMTETERIFGSEEGYWRWKGIPS